MLARQTGLGQPHLSNFLHARRNLSFQALDKILAAQHLTVADLTPERRSSRDVPFPEKVHHGDLIEIVLVSDTAALHDPYPRASAVRGLIPVPASFLAGLKPDCKVARLQWDRYVAIRLPEANVAPMSPLLSAGALLILDRHANILRPHRSPDALAEPPPHLYAVRDGTDLKVRYASLIRGRILLRPHNLAFPVDVPEPSAAETYHDLIGGRVILILRPI